MAHARKPDFVLQRNGRVHLNLRGRQFSGLLAAEVCASAVVMLDTPCYEVVLRVLATHSIRQFPFHFPSRGSPCAITFQLDSNAGYIMFRGSVKDTGYPLPSPVSPSLSLPWVTVCYHISTGLYELQAIILTIITVTFLLASPKPYVGLQYRLCVDAQHSMAVREWHSLYRTQMSR
jgi:hypothetical protein